MPKIDYLGKTTFKMFTTTLRIIAKCFFKSVIVEFELVPKTNIEFTKCIESSQDPSNINLQHKDIVRESC